MSRRHIDSIHSIPSFFITCRGKFRSKPWNDVLREAEHLVAQGAKELNLIAEDTNQYGQDRRDGWNLALLLREISKIDGLRWIRLLYCYPSYFSDDLIDEIAKNPKVSFIGESASVRERRRGCLSLEIVERGIVPSNLFVQVQDVGKKKKN